ncbi:MAG: 1-phosphofructokinase [Verrucomicrobia bacterium]|nr:1-phosphofructokinase [Verrucomicrobiota bacterium]
MVTVTLNPAIDQTVMIPRFRANAVNRVMGEQRTAGGKGINVATFLADYGVPVVVTGFLGRANAGLFEAHFAAKKIEDRLVRVDGSTRVNLKILNRVEGEVTDINFPGLRPTREEICSLYAELGRLLRDRGWFVLSGSLPSGCPDDTYFSLVDALRREGCQVLLDTAGEALRQGVMAQPTVIKPNVRELEEALGRTLSTEMDLVEAARGLVEEGVECVIVSRGAEGALWVDSDGALSARYRGRVMLETTVGAGDALVAGYLAGRGERLDSEAAACLAIAFSIAALQRTGQALPDRSVLKALAGDVEVRRLQESSGDARRIPGTTG